MAMTFDGISSGLPTEQIIKALMSQEAAPLTRLENRQTLNTQKKIALSSIKSSLMSIATALTSLAASSLSKRTVTSSDSAVATATANGAANGSYDLVVSQLASKARLETNNGVGASTASVGDAGATFTLVGKNGTETSIVLEDGKTSLADLNEKINAQSSTTGISSSIIQKRPGEYHLVLTSTETGEGGGDGKIGLFTDSAANPLGLATNSVDAKTAYINATAGVNAQFKLNGVEMERGTNTITDAIEGVTLSLNLANPDKTVTLNIAMDKDSITKMFQDVVDKYNSAYKAYKDASGPGGPLERDMSMQAVFSQLRSKLSVAIPGLVNDGKGNEWMGVVASSSSIGLSTGRDGLLTLDAKAFGEALEKNPEKVSQVFDKIAFDYKDVPGGTKKANGAISFIDSLTIGGSGLINTVMNGLDSVNSALSKQIDDINARLSRREETLKAQFAKMEQLIGQLQSAGQSLGGLATTWNTN